MRMQTTVARSRITSGILAVRRVSHYMDYLAALLHARRSRMAEGERLNALCYSKGLPELYHSVFTDSEFGSVLDFQRRLVQDLTDELSGFRAHMSGPSADLLNWTLVRFQAENLKVLIRACLKKSPAEDLHGHLIALPRRLALDVTGLSAADSLEDFIRLVPRGLLRENLAMALEIYHDNPRPFFFEAALDRGYFQGLVDRVEELSHEDQEIIRPMTSQEADIFHLTLIARGKFHYGLPPELLRPLHIAGTRITTGFFSDMLKDADLYASVGRVADRVFDAVPVRESIKDGSTAVNASILEGLAWNRFLHLANQAFRKGNIGLGAIMGYVGLRRVEVMNLITVSEGIRNGMTGEAVRGRLIPRTLTVEGAM